MAFEVWPGTGDIGPLGKARAPPTIILGDRVELGQIEGDQADGIEFIQRRLPPGEVGVAVGGDAR